MNCPSSRRCCRTPDRSSTSTPTRSRPVWGISRPDPPDREETGGDETASAQLVAAWQTCGVEWWVSRPVPLRPGGRLAGMNTFPDDESTTEGGEGWSEDMELAPIHPRDAEDTEPDDDRPGERLQKVLARAGIGSRRVCEEMIDEGRISVDGKVVRVQGMRVDPDTAVIAVDGRRIDVRNDKVTYAMNKPFGVITAMSDDRGRPTVGDMMGDLAAGLVHVGRLDQDTEGLLLLTTDGELAHRLAHPSYEVKKTYLAQVSGSVPRDLGRRLRQGVELED